LGYAAEMSSKLVILLMSMALVGAGQRGTGGGRGGFGPVDDGPLAPRATTDIARAKAEREQNLKDATLLANLTGKVRDDLSGSSSFTLSVEMLKRLDAVEKVTKRLRARLKTGNPRPEESQIGVDASKAGRGR
jgi:hypothetical protein